MKTEKDAEVVVSENSRIGVLYNDGRYQSISPFNFTLTSKQLIAPDQDLMVNRSDLKTGQVKEVSKGKTTALVTSTRFQSNCSRRCRNCSEVARYCC